MKTPILLFALCTRRCRYFVRRARSAEAEGRRSRSGHEPKACAAEPSAETKPAPAQEKQNQPASVSAPAPAPAPPAGEAEESAHPPLITSELGGRDLTFLTNAIEHGKTQLYLGELARTKATSEQVKAVGEALASTQAEENRKLIQLGAMKGVNLSSEPPHAKKALDARLEKLTGPKLEKTLLEEIVAINQRAVATYEAAVESQDDDIKAFVEQGLPLAEEKLRAAGKMTGTAPRPPKPAAAAAAEAPAAPEAAKDKRAQ
jgi:predicted outer membrane protein